jgi:hypothetical protein
MLCVIVLRCGSVQQGLCVIVVVCDFVDVWVYRIVLHDSGGVCDCVEV